MSLTELFIRSFVNINPRITNLAQKINNNYNLIVNYPLALQPTPSKRHCIVSQHKVKAGNDIFLLSAQQCIFSTGLSGANPSQQKKINEQIQILTTQYESMNTDFMHRMKIYLQLLANIQSTKHVNMPLREYAQFVLNSQDITIPKSQINSRFLFQLYQSWEISNRTTYGFLKKELFKRTEEEQFLNVCNKGKTTIRNAGDTPFKFAAPFLDKIDHSFEPNCKFDVLHFPHRKAPFIRIRTIKDIQQGQKPTISYGKLNNYQLLLRYGFTVKNNPQNIFMLPLNYEAIIQIFNKNINWKQNQFKIHNIKLRNYVKILPEGDIASDDLRMMRILLNDNQNPSDNDISSSNLDPLIYRFVSDHAKGLRRNIKINNLKKSNNQHIQQLQNQEISILQAFIAKHVQ